MRKSNAPSRMNRTPAADWTLKSRCEDQDGTGFAESDILGAQYGLTRPNKIKWTNDGFVRVLKSGKIGLFDNADLKTMIGCTNHSRVLNEGEIVKIGRYSAMIGEHLDARTLSCTKKDGKINVSERPKNIRQPQFISMSKSNQNPYYMPDHPEFDKSISGRLHPYQLHGVVFMYTRVTGLYDSSITGVILADDVGLGKTAQTLSLINVLNRQPNPICARVLIVVPCTLMKNWLVESGKWLGNRPSLIYIIKEPKDLAAFSGLRGYPIIITSYERLTASAQSFKNLKFDLLVCDEAHRLKKQNLKSYAAIKELDIARRVFLTGTPFQNQPSEFHAMANLCSPGCLGRINEFLNDFNRREMNDDQDGFYDSTIIDSFLLRRKRYQINLSKIGSSGQSINFFSFCISSSRETFRGKLPPCTQLIVMCRPSLAQAVRYDQTVEGFLDSWDCSNVLECISNLRLLCGTGDNLVRSGKLTVLEWMVKECLRRDPECRIVVASHFTKCLDAIQSISFGKDVTVHRIDGTVAVSDRQKLVNTFNQTSNQQLMLISAKVGGVGINLPSANIIILFDSGWNPADEEQAIGRVWRQGQTN
ncbi:hypothetical protein ACOME3_003104 [Neoechinorhynchus agilis]